MADPLIFLSSTVDEMQEERNAISEVIVTLRQKISRCEYFPATSESPRQVCLDESRKCDIFIGVYKEKYGNPPPDDNPDLISVTEMEYDEAKKAGKLLLLFYYEDGSKREPRLESFLTKIKHFSKGHYVKKYHNIEELKYLVLQSLVFNLKSLSNVDSETKSNLDSLVPDLIKYQKVLLEQFEYNVTSGISRPSALIQYRTRDLYVPPELQKYENNGESTTNVKHDEFSRGMSVSIAGLGLNWEELEKIASKKDEDIDVITTGINILDKFQEKKSIAILGEAGSGKSTLIKYLCSDLILNSSIIPIFVSIRDFMSNLNTTNSVLDYLKEKYRELELDNKFFYRQLNAGSCVILFDGLDEVWEVKERTKINEIIQQFVSTWANQNKVIITSRISGYFQNPLMGNIEILRIEPFTNKKIADFIYKWAYLLENSKGSTPNLSTVKENSDNLSQLIFDDSHLRKLASSPLVLNIICMTFMKNMTFPKRKHLLYAILIETLLSTRESRKGIDLGELDWTDYAKFLKKISLWMFNGNKLQIKENDMVTLIGEKLRDEGLTQYSVGEIRKIITRLEERSGLISSDGIGNYFFTHLSFLEYFVSVELVENRGITEIYNFFRQRLHDTKNREVISFISSLLSDRSRNDSSTFLELVLNSNTIHEDLHLLDLMLVIRSLSDGSLITDKLRQDIFEKINKSWTIKRIKDFEFINNLTALVSTPFEPYLVTPWREKCKTNSDFYTWNRLTTTLIQKSEYFDDLKQFCSVSKNNDESINNASFVLSALIQSRPSVKLAEYILEVIEHFNSIIFSEGLLMGLAKFVSTNKELRDRYFRKIHEIKSIGLQKSFIKYSYLVDKDRAAKILQQMPHSPSNEKFKTKLLSTHTPNVKTSTLEDERMLALEKCLTEEYPSSNNDSFEIFTKVIDVDDLYDLPDMPHVSSLETYTELLRTYDEKFFKRLMEILEEIPDGKKIVAARLSNVVIRTYDIDSNSREQITSYIQNLTEKQKRWKMYLQEIILKIQPPTDENKKILLTMISDKNELIKFRRNSLLLLVNYFGSDVETIALLTSLLNDNDLRSVTLGILEKYPDIIKKNISQIVSICHSSDSMEFHNSVELLRQYVSTIS